MTAIRPLPSNADTKTTGIPVTCQIGARGGWGGGGGDNWEKIWEKKKPNAEKI